MRGRVSDQINDLGIAVIGMAGRFPGASSIQLFWENIRDGVESISHLSDDELRLAGITDEILARPDYVKAGSFLEGADLFDAAFFNYSPAEAEFMDPQQRVFLECAVEALEDAACDPHRYPGSIGVFAGAAISTYQMELVLSNIEGTRVPGPPRAMITLGTDKDYLATRVSYKLNLRGPSLTLQTACSTSLVAVHLACQSLLCGECDMALAGGVSIIHGPRRAGYIFLEGGIVSPDGRCRPFDADAKGTIFGDGVGIVVLRRLDDALKDHDRIYAVIRGAAVNNDGAAKIGFTAPSVDGQAAVISEALSMAEFDAGTIQYVEAHGTGTALGDPIEIEALQQAFRASSVAPSRCAIGSLKANVGHLNTAAGIAGLIKVVLALQNRYLPPSINFTRLNPQISFTESSFYVNPKGKEWLQNGTLRRAGVSSFGIGGTNAHVVLEEAPVQPVCTPSDAAHLLMVSAKTPTALATATANLIEALRRNPEQNIADVSFTLGTGRAFLPYRRAILCRSAHDAIEIYNTDIRDEMITAEVDGFQRPIVFAFSGQGSQYIGMGRSLYSNHSEFRRHFDDCVDIMRGRSDWNLRDIVFAESDPDGKLSKILNQTEVAQPAIFSISYATAKLWERWGIQPSAMIGHSIGEFAAACLADVFSLESAVLLVMERGRLMQSLPRGSMLAVCLAAEELSSYLSPALSVAAENGPALSVVSGPEEAISDLERELNARGIHGQRLLTSHAFHSSMMDPIIKPFANSVRAVGPKAPKKPYISNVTGTWIGSDEAKNPDFWARHLRAPVKFWAGLTTVMRTTRNIFVEVGPGRTLCGLIKQAVAEESGVVAVPSMRKLRDPSNEDKVIVRALADLWVAGADLDWHAILAGKGRRRVSLPTYPFERQRYWSKARATRKTTSMAEKSCFRLPCWIPCDKLGTGNQAATRAMYLVFADQTIGPPLIRELRRSGHDVVTVERGEDYQKDADDYFHLSPGCADHFEKLIAELERQGKWPTSVAYLWALSDPPDNLATMERCSLDAAIELCFFGPMYLGRAIGDVEAERPVNVAFVTSGARGVTGHDLARPTAAVIFGPCRSISKEYKNIFCSHIDLSATDVSLQNAAEISTDLIHELAAPPQHVAIAYRQGRRWIPTISPIEMKVGHPVAASFRHDGVYMITGGLGDLGLEIAMELFQRYRAKLILVGRSGLPDRDLWDGIVEGGQGGEQLMHRIRAVQSLEKKGAEVLVLDADIADLSKIELAVDVACLRFGSINGVIHAAGVVEHNAIFTKTPDEAFAVLAPKILGTLLLERALRDRTLDCFIVFSSIMSLEGGVGGVAYTAANAFLDAYVHFNGAPAVRRMIAINWDAWREIGMAARTKRSISLEDSQVEPLSTALTTKQGIDAFFEIAANPYRQVVVTNRDLRGLFDGPQAPPSDKRSESRAAPPSNVLSARRLHPRPALRQAYAAPTTEAEQVIAEVWQELLRIEAIGVDDDFFELGGHSLLILQMLPRLRSRFEIELSPREVWAAPTIAALALLVEDKLISELENMNIEGVDETRTVEDAWQTQSRQA
jgi:acyl transferase domain-containing protein